MKRVCVKCEREFKPETNGVIVAEMFQKNTKIYKLWRADLYKCPVCGVEIVVGFGQYPIAEHFTDDCERIVNDAVATGNRRVIYDKEWVS